MSTAIQQSYIAELNKVNDFKRDFWLARSPYVQAKSIHTPRMHGFQIVHVFTVLRSKRNEKKSYTKKSPGKSTVTNRVTLRGILRGVKN